MNKVLIDPVIIEDKEKKQAATIVSGTVVAVGQEVKEVKPNDSVVFSPFGFDEVMIGDKKMIVIEEYLILVVKDEK